MSKRFWAKVDTSGNCWEWTGATDQNGYGRVSWRGRNRFAHRIAYELKVEPVPVGLEIDHLCRNRQCVNPDHMEPVTHAENMARSSTPNRRTHCKRGHPLSGDNLIVNTSARPGRNQPLRQCRKCQNAAQLRSYYKNKDRR